MRRRLMDRKIVELLMGGAGVNSISRALHVSKRRVRRLREQAKEYGYLTEQSNQGPVGLAPYPEAVFPELVDGRTLRLSQAHELLEPHRGWIEERLRAGWHAVTVFEELPVSVSRSSFYRYLERFKLNRLDFGGQYTPFSNNTGRLYGHRTKRGEGSMTGQENAVSW